jgi:uncharacterized membrane protein YdfJ with MMPL/SSD domain
MQWMEYLRLLSLLVLLFALLLLPLLLPFFPLLHRLLPAQAEKSKKQGHKIDDFRISAEKQKASLSQIKCVPTPYGKVEFAALSNEVAE